MEGVDIRSCIPGLDGPRGLPLLTAALLRRGHGTEDVGKMVGGNTLRLLRAELGRPAP
jgi:membrane dipeptidase